MTRAILKGGVIVPIDPLPTEWLEGQELIVESNAGTASNEEDFDRWEREFQELSSNGNSEDDRRLLEAIERQRLEGKARIRREMGSVG